MNPQVERIIRDWRAVVDAVWNADSHSAVNIPVLHLRIILDSIPSPVSDNGGQGHDMKEED